MPPGESADLSEEIIVKITQRAFNSLKQLKKLAGSSEYQRLLEEIKIDYNRALNKDLLDHVV